MIKKKTILSVHDEPLTLLQWLKRVEAKADGEKVVAVEIKATAEGNVVKVTLSDGETIESEAVKAVGALDEFIQHVAQGNVTEIGTNAEVDGFAKINGAIVDALGDAGQNGQVLTSTGAGWYWKNPSGGGTKLYIHTFKDAEYGDPIAYAVTTFAEPIGSFAGLFERMFYGDRVLTAGYQYHGEFKAFLSPANWGAGVFALDGSMSTPTLTYIDAMTLPQIGEETITAI